MEEYIRLEFINLCRLCISYSHSSLDILEISNGYPNITSKILDCLSIKVDENDPLPKKICKSCLDKLESYNEFKLACSNSDATLQCYYSLFKSNIDNDGAIFIKSSEVGLPLQMFQDDVTAPLTSDTCEILHANQQYIKPFREPTTRVPDDSNLLLTGGNNVLVHENFPTSNGQIYGIGSTLQSLNSLDKATPMVFNDSREICPMPSGHINDIPSTFPLSIENENIIVVDINKCNFLDFIDPSASIYVVNTETKSDETNVEQLLQINGGPGVNRELSQSIRKNDNLTKDTIEPTLNQESIDNINKFLNSVYSGPNSSLKPFQEIASKHNNKSNTSEIVEDTEIIQIDDESQNSGIPEFDEDSIDKLIKRGPKASDIDDGAPLGNKEGHISDKQENLADLNKNRVHRTLEEPLPIKLSKPSVPVTSQKDKRDVEVDSVSSVISIIMKQFDDTLKSNNKPCRKDWKYECSKCNKWFKNVHRFEKHLAMHSSNKSYKCETCQITFQKKNALTAHFKIHQVVEGNKKVFKCPDCGKFYGRHWHFNRHAAHHRKVLKKELICHICSRTFCRKENLRQHILFHIKVFLCDICGAKYKDEGAFHKHKATCCILKYTCKLCSTDFDSKTFYLQHVNSNCGQDVIMKPKVQEKKQISCHLCSMTFNEQYKYNMHIEQHKRIIDITKDNHYSGIISVKTKSEMELTSAKPISSKPVILTDSVKLNDGEIDTNSSSHKISNFQETSRTEVTSNPSQDTNLADPACYSNLAELQDIDKSKGEPFMKFISKAEEPVVKSSINLYKTVLKSASDSKEPEEPSSRVIKPGVAQKSSIIEPKVKLTLDRNEMAVEPTLISDEVVLEQELDTYNSNKLVSELTPHSKIHGIKLTINSNEPVLKPSLSSGKQVKSKSSFIGSLVKHKSNLNESVTDLVSNQNKPDNKSSLSLTEHVEEHTLKSNDPVIKPHTSNFNILVEPMTSFLEPDVELTSNSNQSFVEPPSNPCIGVAEPISNSYQLLVEPKPKHNEHDVGPLSKSNKRVSESTPCSNNPADKFSIISNKTVNSSLNSEKNVESVLKPLANSDLSDATVGRPIDEKSSPHHNLNDLIKDISKNPTYRKGLLTYLNKYFKPSDKSQTKNIVLPLTPTTNTALPSSKIEKPIEQCKNKIFSQNKNVIREHEKVKENKDLALNSKSNQNQSIKSGSNFNKLIHTTPSSSIIGNDNSQIEDLFMKITQRFGDQSLALMKHLKGSTEIHSNLRLKPNVAVSQMLESLGTSVKHRNQSSVNYEIGKFCNILQRLLADNLSDKNTSNVAFDKSLTVEKMDSNLVNNESQNTYPGSREPVLKNENVSNRESEINLQTTDLAISINDNLPDTLLTLQPTFERTFKSLPNKPFNLIEGHTTHFVDSSLENFIISEPNFEIELDNLIKEAVQTLDVCPPEAYSVLPVSSDCISQADLKKDNCISDKTESLTALNQSSEMLIESKETESDAFSNNTNIKKSFEETTVSSNLMVEVTSLPLKLRATTNNRETFSKEISHNSNIALEDKITTVLDEDINKISQENLSKSAVVYPPSALITKDVCHKNDGTDVCIRPLKMSSLENLKDKNIKKVISKGALLQTLQTPPTENIEQESFGIESEVDYPKEVKKPLTLNAKFLMKNTNFSDNIMVKENEDISLKTKYQNPAGQLQTNSVSIITHGVAKEGETCNTDLGNVSVLQSTKQSDKSCPDINENQSLIVNVKESADSNTKYLNQIVIKNSDHGSVPEVIKNADHSDTRSGCPKETLEKPDCRTENYNFSQFSANEGEAAIRLNLPVIKDASESKNKIISAFFQADENMLKFDETSLEVKEKTAILENQTYKSKCKKQTVIRNLEIKKLVEGSKDSSQVQPEFSSDKNTCTKLPIISNIADGTEETKSETYSANKAGHNSGNTFISNVPTLQIYKNGTNFQMDYKSCIEVEEKGFSNLDDFEYSNANSKTSKQTSTRDPGSYNSVLEIKEFNDQNKSLSHSDAGIEKSESSQLSVDEEAPIGKMSPIKKGISDSNKTFISVLQSTVNMSQSVKSCNESCLDVREKKNIFEDKFQNQEYRNKHKIQTVIRRPKLKKPIHLSKHYCKNKNKEPPVIGTEKNTCTQLSTTPNMSDVKSNNVGKLVMNGKLKVEDKIENLGTKYIHQTVIRSPLIQKSVPEEKQNCHEFKSLVHTNDNAEKHKSSDISTTFRINDKTEAVTNKTSQVNKDTRDSGDRIIPVFQTTSENSLSCDEPCLVIDDGYENQDTSSTPIHQTVIRSPLINKSIFHSKHICSEDKSQEQLDIGGKNNKCSNLPATFSLVKEVTSKTPLVNKDQIDPDNTFHSNHLVVDKELGRLEVGRFKANKIKNKTKNIPNRISSINSVSPSAGFVILSNTKNQCRGKKRSNWESKQQISLPGGNNVCILKDHSNEKEKHSKCLKLSEDCNDGLKLKGCSIQIEPCNSLRTPIESKASSNHKSSKEVCLQLSEKESRLSKASSKDLGTIKSLFVTKNTIKEDVLSLTSQESPKQPIRTIRFLLERFDPHKAHSSNEDGLENKPQNPFKSQPYNLRKPKKVQTYICTKKNP